jgi:hypothetical protein
MPGDELQKIIETEREHAKALVDAGSKREEVYARIMRAARPTGNDPTRSRPAPSQAEPSAPDAPEP